MISGAKEREATLELDCDNLSTRRELSQIQMDCT